MFNIVSYETCFALTQCYQINWNFYSNYESPELVKKMERELLLELLKQSSQILLGLNKVVESVNNLDKKQEEWDKKQEEQEEWDRKLEEMYNQILMLFQQSKKQHDKKLDNQMIGVI